MGKKKTGAIETPTINAFDRGKFQDYSRVYNTKKGPITVKGTNWPQDQVKACLTVSAIKQEQLAIKREHPKISSGQIDVISPFGRASVIDLCESNMFRDQVRCASVCMDKPPSIIPSRTFLHRRNSALDAPTSLVTRAQKQNLIGQVPAGISKYQTQELTSDVVAVSPDRGLTLPSLIHSPQKYRTVAAGKATFRTKSQFSAYTTEQKRNRVNRLVQKRMEEPRPIDKIKQLEEAEKQEEVIEMQWKNRQGRFSGAISQMSINATSVVLIDPETEELLLPDIDPDSPTDIEVSVDLDNYQSLVTSKQYPPPSSTLRLPWQSKKKKLVVIEVAKPVEIKVHGNKFVDAVIRLAVKRNKALREEKEAKKKKGKRMQENFNQGIRNKVNKKRSKLQVAEIYETLAQVLVRQKEEDRERKKEERWDQMEGRVQRAVEGKLNEIEEARSSVSGDESFYSDHPSVTEFVAKRNKEMKKQQTLLSHRLKHNANLKTGLAKAFQNLIKQTDASMKLESKESSAKSSSSSYYSNSDDQEAARVRKQKRKEKDADGTRQYLKEEVEREAEEDRKTEDVIGKDLTRRLEGRLIKAAQGVRLANGEILIQSDEEDSSAPKPKNLKAAMLQSGNTSLFRIEQSKNIFSDKKQKAVLQFAKQYKQKLAQYKVAKKYTSFLQLEDKSNLTLMKFYEFCNKQEILVKPLLDKIVDKTLTLKNYKFYTGLCKAVAAFLELNPHGLQKLSLTQNNMTGEQTNIVLEKLKCQSHFKCLILQENEINEEAISHLQELFRKKLPDHLEQLRIANCKINWKTTQDLLVAVKQRSFLHKLELIKVNLNEFSVKILAEVIKSSRTITHLDISWNSIIPSHMLGLLEVLSTNRRLQYLNLSWNNLVEQQAPPEAQEHVLLLISRLIKFNGKFLHFDLTGTGLTKFIVKELGRQLRRSRSLLAIHLSANPGLCPETREYLPERMHCRQREDMQRFARIYSTIRQLLATSEEPSALVDAQYLKQARIIEQEKDMFIAPADPFILQRMLGLKNILPGSGQWYESSMDSASLRAHYKHNCWICEGQVFSLVFWNKKYANELKPTFSTGDGKAERICGEIDGGPEYEELENQLPYLAGSFNGWQYEKMRSVFDICVEWDKENYMTDFDKAQTTGRIGRKATTVEKLTLKERKGYEETRINQAFNYTFRGWQNFFRENLKYKKPFIVNGYEMNDMWKNEHEKANLSASEDSDSEDDHGFSMPADLPDMLSSDELSEDERAEKKTLLKRQKARKKRQLKAKREKMERRVKKEEEWKHIKKNKYDSETTIDQPDMVLSESDLESQTIENNDNKIFDAKQLFVLPVFMKPGKQQYLIKYKNTNEFHQRRAIRRRGKNSYTKDQMQPKPQAYFYQTNVAKRQEEIPDFQKKTQTTLVERTFSRMGSCFTSWIPDNEQKILQMHEIDVELWKIGPKMIKDDEDRLQVQKILLEHYVYLKKVFIYLSSKSLYPNLTQLDYSHFVQKCSILDKNVNLAAVDRSFIATNVRKTSNDPNAMRVETQGNALCRFEFMEVIVRLATEKFKSPGLTQTFSEALQRLMRECILPNYQPAEWQEFRDNELWTLEVEDTFTCNLDNLREIYQSWFTQVKKNMDLKDCHHMCMVKCNLGVSEKEIQFCYGMSKMSVINEATSGNQYQKLLFVEFLEFLGRVADSKYKGMSEMTLAMKLEFLLDDIFSVYSMTRTEVNVIVEEISESDSDY